MEFEPTEFVRKSFTVKAVEVTFKNVEQIAEWCKGRVDTETTRILGNETELPVVKFPGQGEDKGKELIARLGYFVVESKGRFRVYKAPQFWASFEQKVVLEEDSCDCDGLTEQRSDDGFAGEDENSSVDGQETVHVSL